MATSKEVFEAVNFASIDGAFNFASYLIETGLFDSQEVANQLKEFFIDQGMTEGFDHADSLLASV
jgi:hypothetical protein